MKRAAVVSLEFGSRALWGAGLVLVGLAVGGCRGRSLPTCAGTSVTPCDTMHGRLVDCRTEQAFTFEGVESSILDATVVSDVGNRAAPTLRMIDPHGEQVDLAPYIASPRGAATIQVKGVVLRRTGTYQVMVRTTVPGECVYYRFNHCLRFPPIECMRTTLRCDEVTPISFTAPRGGMVTVRVLPIGGSGTLPEIRGVEDPWGGRALDRTRVPQGMPQPTITVANGGGVFLNFVAPQPGRYTVLAAAKSGRGGPATIDASVRPMGGQARNVVHPNQAPSDYGMTAGAWGAAPAR